MSQIIITKKQKPYYKSITVSTNVDKETYNEIIELAIQTNRSMSELVKLAIHELLNNAVVVDK